MLYVPSSRKCGHAIGDVLSTSLRLHGLVASVEKAAYVAAKHGVVGLTKVIALETATTGVTCNAICPGWVLTPLVERQIGDKASRQKISIDQAKVDLLSESSHRTNLQPKSKSVSWQCFSARNPLHKFAE